MRLKDLLTAKELKGGDGGKLNKSTKWYETMGELLWKKGLKIWSISNSFRVGNIKWEKNKELEKWNGLVVNNWEMLNNLLS